MGGLLWANDDAGTPREWRLSNLSAVPIQEWHESKYQRGLTDGPGDWQRRCHNPVCMGCRGEQPYFDSPNFHAELRAARKLKRGPGPRKDRG